MTALFDPAAAYDRLPPELQRRLGLAAIITGLAALEGWDTQAFQVANQEASWDIQRLLSAYVLSEEEDEEVPRPDLAAIGIRACDGCGCTDQCACEPPCHWIGDRRCSSCAPAPLACDGAAV